MIAQERCRLDATRSLCDGREAVSPVMPASRAAHLLAIRTNHQAVAAVLQLVDSLRAGQVLRHLRRLAGASPMKPEGRRSIMPLATWQRGYFLATAKFCRPS